MVQLNIYISYWKEFTSLNIKNAQTRNWGEIEVNHVPAIFVFFLTKINCHVFESLSPDMNSC